MARHFGTVAAIAAAAAAIGYSVPQLLQVFGVLGDPWDRILIFAPSLVLAPGFMLAVVAAHVTAPTSRKVWSLGALSLAILYAADVSQIYIVQLASVIPHDVQGHGAETAFAACCHPGMPLTAIDILGYTLHERLDGVAGASLPGPRPVALAPIGADRERIARANHYRAARVAMAGLCGLAVDRDVSRRDDPVGSDIRARRRRFG